jgi:hypothetical protein
MAGRVVAARLLQINSLACACRMNSFVALSLTFNMRHATAGFADRDRVVGWQVCDT